MYTYERDSCAEYGADVAEDDESRDELARAAVAAYLQRKASPYAGPDGDDHES